MAGATGGLVYGGATEAYEAEQKSKINDRVYGPTRNEIFYNVDTVGE